MPAGRGDLEAVPAQRPGRPRRPGPGPGRRGGGPAGGGSSSGAVAADEGDQPVQRVDRPDGHAGHHGRLAGVASGTITRVMPGPGRRGHHRQHAADRPDRAVEAQLAEHHHALQRRRAAARRRRPSRAAAIARSKPLPCLGRVAGSRLTVIRRLGQRLAGVDHRGPDPVAGLVQRGVRQAGEHHGGQPGGQVGLHLDEVAGHADQADAEHPGVAHQNAARMCSTAGAPRGWGSTSTTSKRTSRGRTPGVGQPPGGQPAQPAHLVAGRPPRRACRSASPRRVFTSQNTTSSPSRRIRSTSPVGAAPVAVEHHQALLAQVPRGDPLAVRPDRLSRRRHGGTPCRDRGAPGPPVCGQSAIVDNRWVIVGM